ncbi:MAG: energy transducer TonB [Alphaproteobacteria bacterium]
MSEALSLQAYKPMAQGGSVLSKESLLALGVSFILHAGLFAWFLWNPVWDKSVSQSIASPAAIPISIVTLVTEPAPVPEELSEEPVSHIEPESGPPDIKPKPKVQSKTPASEKMVQAEPVQRIPNPRKEVAAAPSGQQQRAIQQGSFATSGTSAGEADYHDKIRAWLEKHKTYPRRARLSGIEGIVTVDFTMSSSGQVLSKRIAKSSGHHILDQAALDAVEQATPLPAFPNELRQPTMSLSISFSFFLT